MEKKMKACCYSFLIVGMLLLIGASPAMATTYCVANEAELSAALIDAQANESDDLIKLQQGTYIGGFEYVSGETFDLTIEGGYSACCTSRTVDASNTVLDAQEN